jgi:hypothetical protein
LHFELIFNPLQGNVKRKDLRGPEVPVKEAIVPSRDIIIHEIETVPEPLLEEVMDFIQFLKAKSLREGIHTAIASESTLKKDWLCAEEDQAWDDL